MSDEPIRPRKTKGQQPKIRKQIFNEPHTIDLWNGKDTEENSKPWVGGRGRDLFTAHVAQKEAVKKHIEYRWNSLGLRGPEPNYKANKKIIFGGGSLCLGNGVNVEESFPHIVATSLNASYMNLSPADTLTDLIDPLIEFKNFEPDYIILNDTRFFQNYGWALRQIYKMKKLEQDEGYKKHFTNSDIDCLKLFDYFLKGLFPNAKFILAYCERRAWKSIIPNLNNIYKVPFEAKETVVDLARDGFHPGVESHKIMAEMILKGINNV
tara:strand:- start:2454 stop:3251 length:798 start_codon:yes stop_codon:yes gene_type:complete